VNTLLNVTVGITLAKRTTHAIYAARLQTLNYELSLI